MASQQEGCDWIRNHLTYEHWMAQWSYMLSRQQTRGLGWNVCYECFAVHARVLKEFLTNTGDSRSYQANDFVDDYKYSLPSSVLSLVNRMNEQVFHGAKKRTNEDEGKVDSNDLVVVMKWIEDGMADFVSKLKSPHLDYWRPLQGPRLDFTLPYGPTPSTAISMTTLTLGTAFIAEVISGEKR